MTAMTPLNVEMLIDALILSGVPTPKMGYRWLAEEIAQQYAKNELAKSEAEVVYLTLMESVVRQVAIYSTQPQLRDAARALIPSDRWAIPLAVRASESFDP